VTPAHVARIALRLADALSSIAAEAAREEPSPVLLRADYACAVELVDGLPAEWPGGYPAIGPGTNGREVTAVCLQGQTHRAVDFVALAEAWRSWGYYRVLPVEEAAAKEV